ncbi:Uncharacterised protein [Vibrio cholerae]|nr:Uncharacterised protein [Vibrio cholerae]
MGFGIVPFDLTRRAYLWQAFGEQARELIVDFGAHDSVMRRKHVFNHETGEFSINTDGGDLA